MSDNTVTDAELDRYEDPSAFPCTSAIRRLVAEVRRLRGVIATQHLLDRSSVGAPAREAEQMRQAIITCLGEGYRERLESIRLPGRP